MILASSSPSISVDPAWVVALISFGTALGGVVIWGIRVLWRVISRTTRFLDDFFGQPAADGQPAKPGVMARLSQVETRLLGIAAEVHPNGGGSLRDEVSKISSDLADVKKTVSHLSRQIGNGGGRS